MLEELQKYFTSSVHNQQGDLLGLARDNIVITLEPGAQLETSIGPFQDVEEFRREYNSFMLEVRPILERFGAQLLTFGYQPKTLEEDVVLIPKERYAKYG